MWGFGKKKEEQTHTTSPIEPARFYGYGNSLCQMGKAPWPPIIRNDSYHDFTELFRLIAEALNEKHRYVFAYEKLQVAVAQYKLGDKTIAEVGQDAIKVMQVIQNDEKQDAALLALHEKILTDYEQKTRNYGG